MNKTQIRNKIIQLEEKLNSLESFYAPEIQNKNLSTDTKNIILQDYLDQKFETEKELKILQEQLLNAPEENNIPLYAIGIVLILFYIYKKKNK